MGQSANFSAAAVFVRVVESGSIRAAARALAMPKSNVSRRIADLEAQVGARLLQRTTRRLSLTDAGSAYFRGASLAVTTLLDAERAAHELQSEPRGVLRVTAPVAFGTQFLPDVVTSFLRAYPLVEVTLELTDRVVDLVDENFDVALRAGALPDSSLVARRLAGTTFTTVASPAYLAARKRPRKPADLSTHDCLLHGIAHATKWSFRAGRATQKVSVRGRLACTSFYTLRDAAVAGLGVARVPAIVAMDALTEGTLERLLEKFEPPEAPLHVVYPSHRHLAPKVRAFVDMLSIAFDTPPWHLSPRAR